jgi:hypothetical protein
MPSTISRTPNDLWSWPNSLQALVAAPDHHSLLLENDKIRAVHTRIPLGQTVPVHPHRFAGVRFIESWSDFIRRDQHGIVLFDARQLRGKTKLNAPLWQAPLPPHAVKNVGSGEFNAVEVEIKDVPSGTPQT